MDLNLQPLASACFVSRQPFAAGDRVVSYLIRGAELQVLRADVLAAQAEAFVPEGAVACRWVHVFKPKTHDENPERTLKLTAETLFLTLADPTNELTPETERLVRFLALMLERKKLLRARGKTADGTKDIFEHGRSKQFFEIPAGEMTPEFFAAVQEQLGMLVGEPKIKPPVAESKPAEPVASA